jgi:hypothetical protein
MHDNHHQSIKLDGYKPDNNNWEHMITMIIYNNIIVTYQNYNHL